MIFAKRSRVDVSPLENEPFWRSLLLKTVYKLNMLTSLEGILKMEEWKREGSIERRLLRKEEKSEVL